MQRDPVPATGLQSFPGGAASPLAPSARAAPPAATGRHEVPSSPQALPAGGGEPGLSFQQSPSASRDRGWPAALFRGAKCSLSRFERRWLTSSFLLASSSPTLQPSTEARGSFSSQGSKWKRRAQRTGHVSLRDIKGGMCPCC